MGFRLLFQAPCDIRSITDLDFVALVKFLTEPGEGRLQSKIIEQGRPQQLGDLVRVADEACRAKLVLRAVSVCPNSS